MSFEWDEGNIEHIARHGLEPEDAEEAMTDPRRVPAGAYNSQAERRWSILGATESGRILRVVYTTRPVDDSSPGSGGLDQGERFRVVTARDASLSEKRRYRR